MHSREAAAREAATRLTVLVVDDQPQVASAIAMMLEAELVYTAISGQKALEACRVIKFDVILCDVQMPQMSGPALYDALRDLGGGLHERLIFMTGWSAAASELAKHGRTVLTKPFDAATLEAVLQRFRNAPQEQSGTFSRAR